MLSGPMKWQQVSDLQRQKTWDKGSARLKLAQMYPSWKLHITWYLALALALAIGHNKHKQPSWSKQSLGFHVFLLLWCVMAFGGLPHWGENEQFWAVESFVHTALMAHCTWYWKWGLYLRKISTLEESQ